MSANGRDLSELPMGEPRSSERMCWTCGVLCPWDEFAIDRAKPSGHKSICKRCDRERSLARYYARRSGDAQARTCSECGKTLEGRQRVTCGSGACRDARLKRTNPRAYRRRADAKVERRREQRRGAG